ncbi:MAG: 4Fe-4S dicluster domain-containing protein [Calditrichaeota bacterium]|nr:MAG: 4Fe-4S dicluster domain-containing protein [Calditrichota bacterium]MBL1206229.1 4Fe-4S dicluster domain-containing protein [Calditrichota bacterium]NOG46055.1 4Fe-4S binding protein [Calditrichota bacterium]
MFEIEVNGQKIEAIPGETVLSSLERSGISVPTLCHIKDMIPSGACRICSVEVEGQKSLIPSCSYPVYEGMKIKTNSPRAIRARKTIVELLQANHPDDCLYCVRNTDCELQSLSAQHGIREKRYIAEPCKHPTDVSSSAIIREQDKCILCGKCVRVCEEVVGVGAIDFVNRGSKTIIAPAFEQGMNVSSCINCGQCVVVCPTGALREKSHIKEVTNALQDPEKIVVIQHAPAISVTIAEELGLQDAKEADKIMVNALRKLGFDRVFDTSFSADLTIMEEASELVQRIQSGGTLPMMTSCSPGWVKYMEQSHPELLDNVSTCKSPQQMLGAIIKSYYAQKEGIDPKNIYSVAVMPCTAKKFEAGRPELGSNGLSDLDAVLTTRELIRMFKMFGVQYNSLVAAEPDLPFGERSSAGKLFGGTGGVMEAALRTAHKMITGNEMDELVVKQVRGLCAFKETKIKIGDMELGIAVANGIKNAKKILQEIKDGRDDIHFIEVMTCNGGCIGGGGQPCNTNMDNIKTRLKSLYQIDTNAPVRTSHGNKAIKELYDDFLGEPLGEKSHELLHTHYSARDVLL